MVLKNYVGGINLETVQWQFDVQVTVHRDKFL